MEAEMREGIGTTKEWISKLAKRETAAVERGAERGVEDIRREEERLETAYGRKGEALALTEARGKEDLTRAGERVSLEAGRGRTKAGLVKTRTAEDIALEKEAERKKIERQKKLEIQAAQQLSKSHALQEYGILAERVEAGKLKPSKMTQYKYK